jgi:hypothetical protein
VPEQAVVGRATNTMRLRFLSGCRQISTLLSSLEEHAKDIRVEVRASVSATAREIKARQERLQAQMDGLPAQEWERFKSLLRLLRAQQGVLEAAEALMHKAWPNGLPGEPRSRIEVPATRAQGKTSKPSDRLPAQVAPQRVPVSPRRDGKYPAAKVGTRAVLRGAASLRLALLVMLVGGLVIGYVKFPRESKSAAMATEGRSAGVVHPPTAPPRLEPGPVVAPAAPPQITAAKPPPTLPQETAAERPPPAPALPAAPRDRPQSAPPGHFGAAERPAPRPTPPPVVAALPPHQAAASAPKASIGPAPPAEDAGSRLFVPVVYTHEDHATAMQTFAKLQTRYAGILSSRDGEVQSVDMGKKGIWHRLVVLPAGSQQQATELCDQLKAAGHDRCWVKAY